MGNQMVTCPKGQTGDPNAQISKTAGDKFIENSIQDFEKHFWKHRNELIGLDFILKVAECRAALYLLRTEHITLGYSDMAVVTSSSSRSEVVNCNKLNKVFL